MSTGATNTPTTTRRSCFPPCSPSNTRSRSTPLPKKTPKIKRHIMLALKVHLGLILRRTRPKTVLAIPSAAHSRKRRRRPTATTASHPPLPEDQRGNHAQHDRAGADTDADADFGLQGHGGGRGVGLDAVSGSIAIVWREWVGDGVAVVVLEGVSFCVRVGVAVVRAGWITTCS